MPECRESSAEGLKADNLFHAYPQQAQLFRQDKTDAVFFLLDGNIIILGRTDTQEAKQFISFLHPKSVFSNEDNLRCLFKDYERVNVIICKKPMLFTGTDNYSGDISSRELYDILSVDEFDLPPYEYFATDYCRRKNRGLIKTFSKEGLCAAITLEGNDFRLLGGIASRQKGLGGALLLAAISGDKPVLAVCRDKLLPFYTKYGFEPLYTAGYWRKEN